MKSNVKKSLSHVFTTVLTIILAFSLFCVPVLAEDREIDFNGISGTPVSMHVFISMIHGMKHMHVILFRPQ